MSFVTAFVDEGGISIGPKNYVAIYAGISGNTDTRILLRSVNG
jgi:hypothetical protein